MTSGILPNHPFCRFCTQVEQQAAVALQSLRVRHDLNITLLLFCCWYAVNQHGLLSKAQVKQLLSTLYAWHQRIVSPLDGLCNQLKEVELDPWVQTLTHDVLTAKHTAEQIEQLLIVEVLAKKSRRNRPSLTQATTHACLNVGAYCQSVYVSLDEVDYANLGEILAAVFPDLEVHRAASLCRNVLLERQSREPVQKPLVLG